MSVALLNSTVHKVDRLEPGLSEAFDLCSSYLGMTNLCVVHVLEILITIRSVYIRPPSLLLETCCFCRVSWLPTLYKAHIVSQALHYLQAAVVWRRTQGAIHGAEGDGTSCNRATDLRCIRSLHVLVEACLVAKVHCSRLLPPAMSNDRLESSCSNTSSVEIEYTLRPSGPIESSFIHESVPQGM